MPYELLLLFRLDLFADAAKKSATLLFSPLSQFFLICSIECTLQTVAGIVSPPSIDELDLP